MCGFLITINCKISKRLFQDSLYLLEHRGRDDTRILNFNKSSNDFFIGFNRLSIIDRDKRSMQPFTNNNQNIYLLFNGEIYNYIELKDEIKNIYNFKTTSDTEVIFAIYELYGIDVLLTKLKGMFAITIIDLIKQKIYTFTDKTNQKPLYFYKKNSTLIISSESKPILNLSPEIRFNKNIIKSEVFFGHNFNCDTIYEGVRQLPRSTILKYDIISHESQEEEYTYFKPSLEKKNNLKKNLLDHYDFIFYETIKKHCLSDVPMGILYSGGLDSSIIATYAKRIKDKKIPLFFFNSKDNSHYKIAKLINKNNDFDLISVSDIGLDILKEFIDTVYNFEKVNKVEGIFLSKVCEAARKEGFKVLLSGDGADEVFGGYEFHTDFTQKFFFYKHKYFINIFKFLRKFTSFNPFIVDDGNSINLNYLFQPLRLSNLEILLNLNFNNFEKIKEWKRSVKICKDFESHQIESAYLNFVLNNRLHIYTHRADRIGMSKNVEIRCPFLYEDIINLSINTEFKKKISQNLFLPPTNKFIIKKLAKKIGVPDQIINQPKVGTEFNLNNFFQDIFDKIKIKHANLVFSMSEAELKYIMNSSNDTQKYTYQYAILTIEILGRIFFDKMKKIEVYNELKSS